MKRLFSLIPKKTLAVFGIVALVAGATLTIHSSTSGSVHAWWPVRQTFTVAAPAPYVTFNSITDNPNYGNELTFFDAKNAANTASGGYSDGTQVTDGEKVLLRVYVHNDASANLDNPNNTGPGVAHNTSVRVYLPTATATALQANAYVDASNANPLEVSDSTGFSANSPFSLSYVTGSATAYNHAHPTGMPLSDSIVTTGAPIGYQQADGNQPGCFQYVNLVTVEAVVHMAKPSFSITKQVAIPGQAWTKSTTVTPGSTVSYLLTVKNTGNDVLNNLSVRDALPAHEHIITGTTSITNASNPNGVAAGNDNLVSNGINIGNYDAGAVAYVKFKATVDPASLLPCGTSSLVNSGTVFQPGNNVTETDTATVTVSNNQNCTPVTPVTPTTPPTQLVNTGPGSVVGIFAAVSIVAAVGHRMFKARQLARNSK
jgi:uncharacterized repeat protein (TIGR01451 family)